jgi:hypothetical protein
MEQSKRKRSSGTTRLPEEGRSARCTRRGTMSNFFALINDDVRKVIFTILVLLDQLVSTGFTSLVDRPW